jgi:hypothetical protein
LSFFPFLSFPYFSFSFLVGKRKGHELAKEEVRDAAKFAVEKTMAYIDRDAARLRQGSPVSKEYMKTRVKIQLLPRWSLDILGDKYVVRRPLRATWTSAWFMTAADSEEMDRRIQEMHKPTPYTLPDSESTRHALHGAVEALIDNYVDKLDLLV